MRPVSLSGVGAPRGKLQRQVCAATMDHANTRDGTPRATVRRCRLCALNPRRVPDKYAVGPQAAQPALMVTGAPVEAQGGSWVLRALRLADVGRWPQSQLWRAVDPP